MFCWDWDWENSQVISLEEVGAYTQDEIAMMYDSVGSSVSVSQMVDTLSAIEYWFYLWYALNCFDMKMLAGDWDCNNISDNEDEEGNVE